MAEAFNSEEAEEASVSSRHSGDVGEKRGELVGR